MRKIRTENESKPPPRHLGNLRENCARPSERGNSPCRIQRTECPRLHPRVAKDFQATAESVAFGSPFCGKEEDKSLRDAHIVRKTLRRIERNAKTDSERKAIGRIAETMKSLVAQKVALPPARHPVEQNLENVATRIRTLENFSRTRGKRLAGRRRSNLSQRPAAGRQRFRRQPSGSLLFLAKMGQIPLNPTRRAVRERPGSGFRVAEKDCAVGGTLGQLSRSGQPAANGARAFGNHRRFSDGAMFLPSCPAHGVPGDSAFPKKL